MNKICGHCLYYVPDYDRWESGDCMHQLDAVTAEMRCNLKDEFEFNFAIPTEWLKMKCRNATPSDREALERTYQIWRDEVKW